MATYLDGLSDPLRMTKWHHDDDDDDDDDDDGGDDDDDDDDDGTYKSNTGLRNNGSLVIDPKPSWGKPMLPFPY